MSNDDREPHRHDFLQRFLFDAAPVRGEIVQLRNSWQEVLARREYPPVLKKLVGELMAAATLMTAMLKFDGSLIMQLHGTGEIKLIVIECEADLTIRATARWDEHSEIADRPLIDLLGEGKFVITLDPKDDSAAYQGIVGLQGDSIAEIIEHYMHSSEQLDTRVWLACDDSTTAGLMLQKLPAGQGDPDAWQRLTLLAGTITNDELLNLPTEQLLHRLFHEETLRLMTEDHPHFGCRCSRERVGNMLKMLGREEADSVVAERGVVEVNCDFCNQNYQFDAIDVAHLFQTDFIVRPDSTLH